MNRPEIRITELIRDVPVKARCTLCAEVIFHKVAHIGSRRDHERKISESFQLHVQERHSRTNPDRLDIQPQEVYLEPNSITVLSTDHENDSLKGQAMALRIENGVETRRHQRHKASIPITLILNNDVSQSGFSKDISESGIQALVFRPLNAGDNLIILLEKIGSTAGLSVKAHVTRTNGADHGFEFTDLTAEQKRIIKQLYCTPIRSAQNG